MVMAQGYSLLSEIYIWLDRMGIYGDEETNVANSEGHLFWTEILQKWNLDFCRSYNFFIYSKVRW